MSQTPDTGPADDPQKSASKSRYEVLSMLAEGSLGRVWLARDQSLGRVVALKELKPRLATSAEARERFLREAQITGRLEHHSIVPVYDLDLDEPFYAMRRIPGRTLSEAIDEYHRTPPAKGATDTGLQRLLGAFVRICEAIAYANERGVVHRDLKPANVQLGDYGEVFVLDWGLAKVLSAAEPGTVTDIHEPLATEETTSGKVMGTPGYMAPEQAAGRAVSARTDVFGLGAILYKILTGKAPHAHIEERSPEQFLLRVQQEPVPPARSIRSTVPAPLEAVCRHCLALNPDERYPSALALADDVRRWLLGEPVVVYREPWGVRLARWVMRHPALAQVLATVVLVGIIAATAFTIQVWKEDDQLKQIHLRELAGHADHMENTIHFELMALHSALDTNSRLPLLRALGAELAARPDSSPLSANTLGRALHSVIHNRPVVRRISVVAPGRDFRELVAAHRVGEHDAEVVPGERLQALGKNPDLGALVARMKTEPDACHLSPFLRRGDETIFYAAQPLAGTEPRVWLVVEASCGPMFEQMLAPIKRKGLAVLLRNEEGSNLHEETLEAQHGAAISTELANGSADPRLGKFLRAEGGDVLALPSAAPDADVLLARKIAYDSDDPRHRLDVILVSPREDVVRERTFDRRWAALLTAFVMLVIAGIALVSSRFVVRAAQVRG